MAGGLGFGGPGDPAYEWQKRIAEWNAQLGAWGVENIAKPVTDWWWGSVVPGLRQFTPDKYVPPTSRSKPPGVAAPAPRTRKKEATKSKSVSKATASARLKSRVTAPPKTAPRYKPVKWE